MGIPKMKSMMTHSALVMRRLSPLAKVALPRCESPDRKHNIWDRALTGAPTRSKLLSEVVVKFSSVSGVLAGCSSVYRWWWLLRLRTGLGA